MFVSLAIHDIGDSSVVNSEQLSQPSLRVWSRLRASAQWIACRFIALVQFSDCSHFIIREYAARGDRDIRPLRSPTLVDRIPIVLKILAQKKVIRPNAWRIVAFVKHLQTIRNRSICQFPRNAVSQSASLPETPIAVGVAIASPDPAGRGFLDLLPEAINRFHGREVYQFGG